MCVCVSACTAEFTASKDSDPLLFVFSPKNADEKDNDCGVDFLHTFLRVMMVSLSR